MFEPFSSGPSPHSSPESIGLSRRDGRGFRVQKQRYRYRFYPNPHQQQALAQLFGCVRVAWNDALVSCKDRKYLGFARLDKELTQSKKKEERLWMRDVSSVPLTQAIRFEPFSSRPQQGRGFKVQITRRRLSRLLPQASKTATL